MRRWWFRIGGCVTCHTDAKDGVEMLGGGSGLVTPFGTFYAPDITSHPEGDRGDERRRDLAVPKEDLAALAACLLGAYSSSSRRVMRRAPWKMPATSIVSLPIR